MELKTRNICMIVACVLMLTAFVTADVTTSTVPSTPQWNTGDSWKVGAWHWQVYRPSEQPQMGAYKVRGRSISVLFEVVGSATIGTTDCYEVKVTFPKEETGFKRLLRVFYAKDTRKLIRVRDVSQLCDGSNKDLTTDVVQTPQGPVFPDSIPGAVPLEWPDMTQQNVTPQADATGKTTTAQSTAPVTVQTTTGTLAQENEVTLTKTTPKRQEKVVQHWRKADPWWRTAQKFEGDKLVSEAVLLEVNGQTVGTMPAPDQ